MLQFLNPIALFAIAALSIPLVIHLWNNRPGKTLKVGSIALVTASSRKSSLSFKLSDIWLLLLRCLLLLLLAILLAQPFWKQYTNTTKVKGWLLLPPRNIGEAYHHFGKQIDSLVKRGYQLRYFSDEFALIPADSVTKVVSKTAGRTISNDTAQYWPLLRVLQRKIPRVFPVYVITDNRLVHFAGLRPQLSLPMHWLSFTPDDSVSRGINQAWLTGIDDDIRIAEAQSTPEGTIFSYSTLSAAAQATSDYQVSFNSGLPFVGYKNNTSGTVSHIVPVDTAILRIAIYPGEATDEAMYLKAALNALREFTQRRITVSVLQSPKAQQQTTDWLFWLAKAKPDIVELKNAKHVFICESGKVADVNTFMQIPANMPLALYKRVLVVNHAKDNSLWTDGFGNPVLTRDTAKSIDLYHFYSRFNPAWNDLVWNEAFPAIIMDLVLNGKATATKNGDLPDKRVIAQGQMMPAHHAIEATNQTSEEANTTDLYFSCWLIALVVFIAERLLAHGNKKKEVYG